MVKKDLKKTEHAVERHDIAEDIVAIRNLKSVSQEKKDELIAELLAKKENTETKKEKKDLGPVKESKETMTKSLEFEEDTFKIDSKGWKEEKRNVYGKGKMKVKINATGDVVEYLEGPVKGEQIFITYDAFIREVMKAKNCSKEEVEKKYLMTVDELKEKMKDKPSGSDEYKKFFNKEVKDHLAGYWVPDVKSFGGIGERSSVWLAGGYNADFDEGGWNKGHYYRNYFGFSGRLLKN